MQFPQPSATFSILDPNILLSTLFSNTLSVLIPLVSDINSYTHKKQEVEISTV